MVERQTVGETTENRFQVAEEAVLSIRIVMAASRFRVLAAANRALPRAFGRSAGKMHTMALIALIPLILNTPLLLVDQGCNGESVFWLAYFGLLNLSMLTAADWVWRRFVRLQGEVDHLLGSIDNRRRLLDWMTQTTNSRLQTAVACAGAIFGFSSPSCGCFRGVRVSGEAS
jgi:hypothetical protein